MLHFQERVEPQLQKTSETSSRNIEIQQQSKNDEIEFVENRRPNENVENRRSNENVENYRNRDYEVDSHYLTSSRIMLKNHMVRRMLKQPGANPIKLFKL